MVRFDRYYDPSTDQFLSVDPAVATTGQPYAFTGDDPLNGTDPLGLYHYKYKEKIGKVSKIGSPASLMHYFLTHLKKVFPFPVDGPNRIGNGSQLVLHPAPSFVKGVGSVSVGEVTDTSFTFTVSKNGYFDPKGSQITFSTFESHGNDYLEQTANAPKATGVFNLLGPSVANFDWQEQATNLSQAVGGDYSSTAVNTVQNAGSAGVPLGCIVCSTVP